MLSERKGCYPDPIHFSKCIGDGALIHGSQEIEAEKTVLIVIMGNSRYTNERNCGPPSTALGQTFRIRASWTLRHSPL